jgi:hypothetical protein
MAHGATHDTTPAGGPLPPPPPGAEPLAAPDLVAVRSNAALHAEFEHEAVVDGVKLQLCEEHIAFGKVKLAAFDVQDLAFWTQHPGRHHVHLQGAGPNIDIAFKGRAKDTLHNYAAVVKWLEREVVANVLEDRLTRLSIGLTVRIGRLELREEGLRWRRVSGTSIVSWNAFDHVTIARRELAIVVRGGKGKLRTFAELPHNELNAVLVPMLVPAAANSFRV